VYNCVIQVGKGVTLLKPNQLPSRQGKQMTNFVSVRITKDSKSNVNFQLNHDFNNSHGRKINTQPNFLITDKGTQTFYRDLLSIDKPIQKIDAGMQDKIDHAIDYAKHLHKYVRHVDEGKQRRKLKSNTQLKWSGIITFGNDTQTLTQEDINQLDQNQLNKNALSFFNEFIEKNNLDKESSYLVRHNDENMTHYHFKFVGYDEVNHQVFSNRVKKIFFSQLQDSVGKHFESSGFQRGTKKYDRILEEMQKTGRDLDDYMALSINEKAEIKRQVNVVNKSVNELHNTLKDKVTALKKDLSTCEILAEKVYQSTPEELKKIQTEVDEDHNKLIKRFFTYACRLHNKNADQEKAKRNLERTLKKLEHDEEALKKIIREFEQQRYEQTHSIDPDLLNFEDTSELFKQKFNMTTINKENLKKLNQYIKNIEQQLIEQIEINNKNHEIVKLSRQHLPELNKINTLKETLKELKNNENTILNSTKNILKKYNQDIKKLQQDIDTIKNNTEPMFDHVLKEKFTINLNALKKNITESHDESEQAIDDLEDGMDL